MADPLIINNTGALAGQPGIHALIVGVSEYEHLPAANAISGDPKFGMKRLTSPALSALSFYRWLVDHNARGKLALPLKTCRLLLSPSPEEKQVEPKFADVAQAPSACFDELKSAAVAWRDDASDSQNSPQDMTIFYFSGHGLWSTPTETILASADFLKPPTAVATPLERCVAFQNIKKGMAPQTGLANIALKQIYFLDCCRNFPEYLINVDQPQVGVFFDIMTNRADRRELSIYYSTVPGNLAIGISGQQSVFCKALLHALDKAVDKEQAFNDGVWAVTTNNVKVAIERYLFNEYKINEDLPPEAAAARTRICYLDGPPKFDLTIDVRPPAAQTGAQVILRNWGRGRYPAALDLNRNLLFIAHVPFGTYMLKVQPAAGAGFKPFSSPPRSIDHDTTLPWRVMLESA